MPNFALFYSPEDYSMSGKIMGRQSAGNGLIRGISRRWSNDTITCVGCRKDQIADFQEALQRSGHSGSVKWRDLQEFGSIKPGAIYYPAPLKAGLAHARNKCGTTSYSMFGVTHTLSSINAMDSVAETILPCFQSWDALVCTSSAALVVVERLQEDLRDWMRDHLGATRFGSIQTPVIPLGIDAPSFVTSSTERSIARQSLGLDAEDVAFLFAGRLAFHAKANPAAFYHAIEVASKKVGRRLTVIEAGIYPNDVQRTAFVQARSKLAPSARFIQIDGIYEEKYKAAWQAADVFVSLSDNIQETFGLTPLEAMAAGLPVIVSDWDGYKETVRDEVDGYRISTLLPPANWVGNMIARRHAAGADSYDRYIGRVSLATAIDIDQLVSRTVMLAKNPALRKQLGASGKARAFAMFDWPVILDRYALLVDQLDEERDATPGSILRWPMRPDPFALFSHYPSAILEMNWVVGLRESSSISLDSLLEITVSGYSFNPQLLSRDTILRMHHVLASGKKKVAELLNAARNDQLTDISGDDRLMALMWLIKFGLVRIEN